MYRRLPTCVQLHKFQIFHIVSVIISLFYWWGLSGVLGGMTCGEFPESGGYGFWGEGFCV